MAQMFKLIYPRYESDVRLIDDKEQWRQKIETVYRLHSGKSAGINTRSVQLLPTIMYFLYLNTLTHYSFCHIVRRCTSMFISFSV